MKLLKIIKKLFRKNDNQINMAGNIEYMYKLRDWIPLNKLSWSGLSKNPRAIYMLEMNKENIDWRSFSLNPNAMYLLYNKKKKINWENLSENPGAILFLKKNLNKVSWYNLSANPTKEAIEILMENMDKIQWTSLSKNSVDEAIDLLKEYPHKICWDELSRNPNKKACKLLLKNMEKINWWLFSLNSSEWSVKILEKYPHRIYMNYFAINPFGIHLLNFSYYAEIYDFLSENPCEEAIQILQRNQNKIDWYRFSSNPEIFVYDYERMKKHFYGTYGKELVEKLYHPNNFHKFGEDYWNI